MIDHVIVAFVAVVTALFICAAAPSIDKATGTLNFDNLRGAAKASAIREIQP